MKDFQVVMLASGSKGNASLISTDSQRFLVDLGISCRMACQRLKAAGASPEELDGIFITHEHIDHIKGLEIFLTKYKLPVYSSESTWRAILGRFPGIDRSCCRVMPAGLLCGDVQVSSFQIPHDAADPHGYSFTKQSSGTKCTYLTDTGFVTPIVREAVAGTDTLILEANHDVKMLKEGSYPPALKQRILSTRGHLSNDSAGFFLKGLERIPRHVILAHLSEENNRPGLARDTVRNILEAGGRLQETRLFVASQHDLVRDFDFEEPKLF